MCVRYLGFVLLLWFPAVLHATQTCSAPSLDGGYFVPVQEIYSHGTNLSYSCDNGLKPAAEGWWATSTCENATWTPKPQCIDEKNCIPPNIPNAKYTEASNGGYKNQSKIRIKCDKAYVLKDNQLTAQCINGTWSSLPICEKSRSACGHPPEIPHAVIIKQKYQEVFAVDSAVEYECKHGYTKAEGQTQKSICMSGTWTGIPTCTRTTSAEHSESEVGGTGGGHTTSAGSGTQPVGGGIASSTSSGSLEIEVEPRRVTIENCGKHPGIQNGDVVETHSMFLKYQCNNFYSLVGSERVECYSNGKWSEVPTCKAVYCTLNTEEDPVLKSDGVKFIKDGETVTLECVRQKHWWADNFSLVQCTEGRLTLSQCCNKAQIKLGIC